MGLLGLAWRAAPADIIEAAHLAGDPLVAALNVALAKARATQHASDAEVTLAADTVVVAPDGRLLAKPVDTADARAMLAALRGRAHAVITGVALRAGSEQEWGAAVMTRVHMRAYAEHEVRRYVERGEPFDKAGGYAVQDQDFRPVERLEGCYLNVVGLPLCATARGLQTLGVKVDTPSRDWQPPCGYCTLGAPLVALSSRV